MTAGFATAVAVAFVLAGLAALAVMRMHAVHETFNFIVEPLGPPSGEYIPSFPEIDALTQDVLLLAGKCFRCEDAPVTTPSSLYCGPCREIVTATPAEPIEQGALR